MKLRIGTRGSKLARAQAADVARRLSAHGHEVEIVVITTAGDRRGDVAFTDIGPFGVFVREIEAALLAGEIDVAVHSCKDLPSRSHEELTVAAVPERVDPADMLLVRRTGYAGHAGGLPLRSGARVGTSAARRQALLREARPDLDISLLRGNVPTRIAMLMKGHFDAIVVATAGLIRLSRDSSAEAFRIDDSILGVRLEPSRFVPAPAQGAVAVQVRRDRAAVCRAVAAIDDPAVATAIRAERRALALAEAGCTQPFGAWCRRESGETHRLFAVLGTRDGAVRRAVATGADPDALALAVWNELAGAVPAAS